MGAFPLHVLLFSRAVICALASQVSGSASRSMCTDVANAAAECSSYASQRQTEHDDEASLLSLHGARQHRSPRVSSDQVPPLSPVPSRLDGVPADPGKFPDGSVIGSAQQLPSSWSVPHYPVSLPSGLGNLPEYPFHWWYMAGKAEDKTGKSYGIFVHMDRISPADGDAISGSYISFTVPGGGKSGEDVLFQSTEVLPFFAGQEPSPEVTGAFVPPVTDSRWLLQHSNRSSGQSLSFEYDESASDGAKVGQPGAVYNLRAQGQARWTNGKDAEEGLRSYSIDLVLRDERGVVITGTSYGLADMDYGLGISRPSMEYAMPHLRMVSGSLSFLGTEEPTELANGFLWLDMQCVQPSSNGVLTLSDGNLYQGTWMNMKFNSGLQLQAWSLVGQQEQKGQQWISGSKVGRPYGLIGGNVIYPLRDVHAGRQGGAPLWSSEDVDLNILNPLAPAVSPHWVSPVSNRTYSFAWSVNLNQPKIGQVPRTVYIFPFLAPSTDAVPELRLSGPAGVSYFSYMPCNVFEDAERERPIGFAWMEQWMN